MELVLKPIGIIHSPYENKDETPIQGAFQPDGQGRVEVFDAYIEGLKDVESFSHIILIYWFHEAGNVKLVRPTFLDDEPHGIFSSRHPCRPNGLGFTVVKLLRREDNFLIVSRIDVLNATPLIDIKPYLPQFDCYPEATKGWTEGKDSRPKPKGYE